MMSWLQSIDSRTRTDNATRSPIQCKNLVLANTRILRFEAKSGVGGELGKVKAERQQEANPIYLNNN
jgi:hypothetical protein